MNRTKREYENINLTFDCTLIASANERGMSYLHNVNAKLHEQYIQDVKCAECVVLSLLQREDTGTVPVLQCLASAPAIASSFQWETVLKTRKNYLFAL